jgi:hypothetical protein
MVLRGLQAASQMTEWNGSGTNGSEWLAWGMRALSPQPPYTDAAPWKTQGVSKIVMVLTDGENVVYGASGQPTKSDYTSYGYLAGGRSARTTRRPPRAMSMAGPRMSARS